MGAVTEDSEEFEELVRRADALASEDGRFQRALSDARMDAGLSQAAVEERLGWAPGKCAEFESYWYDPSLSEIRRYALAVGVHVSHSVDRVDV